MSSGMATRGGVVAMIVDSSGRGWPAHWIAERCAGEWMVTSAGTYGVVVGLADSGRSVRLRMENMQLELWNAEDLTRASMRPDNVAFLLKMLARARCGCFALDCREHCAYVAEDIERCERLQRDATRPQRVRQPAGGWK